MIAKDGGGGKKNGRNRIYFLGFNSGSFSQMKGRVLLPKEGENTVKMNREKMEKNRRNRAATWLCCPLLWIQNKGAVSG